MKKNESSKKTPSLKLNRETLLSLDKELRLVMGGDDPSVQFCTQVCTTTG